MQNDFSERFAKATSKAANRFRDEEKKLEINRFYAGLYLDFILECVENFDFRNNKFNIEGLRGNLKREVLGTPVRVDAALDDYNKCGVIAVNYERGSDLRLEGLPSFMSDDSYNFDAVNAILEENGVKVEKDLWDGGERGSDSFWITFDASILISERDELQKESGFARHQK